MIVAIYPNALYAEIEVDYVENTISLIRGHRYPEKEIDNEFDLECNDWEFYEIDNGKMLNCFPERQLYEDKLLLKVLKEL